jgi:hypothetical protein
MKAMFTASRFALPAALSLSLSSLAVSTVLADGTSAAPQPAPRAAGDVAAAVPTVPHLRAWSDVVPPTFGEKFTQLLEREAKGHMDLAAVPPPSAAAGTEATASTPIDGGSDRRVRSILTRALRGVLDEELATLTQNAPFAMFLRRGDGREDIAAAATLDSSPGRRMPGASPGAPADDPAAGRFDASFGVRLDAHPRLQLRTRFGAFSGVVEVPVLDPELRVGLERSIGPAGRAQLRAGAGGARGDWASLNFAFGF